VTRIMLAATLFPESGRDADSLLIVSSSFERRCLGFCSHLRKNAPHYRADQVLLLSYDDRGDATVRARVARFAPQLRTLVQTIATGNKIEQHTMDPYAILDAREYFGGVFASLPVNSSVVVDVSTISKLHLLYILDAAANSARIGRLKLAYTRARYGRYDTLSWGAEEPLVLPGFGRPRAPHQDEHLLLFCGLEPDRCYSIWRRFGQNACTRIFIDSGKDDLDRCAERAKRLNAYDPRTTTDELPAFDPDGALRLIESKYLEATSRGEYLYVAPMTTKWEVLAVWQFMRSKKLDANAGIVYAVPGRLNAAGHTWDDLGECLVADVSFASSRHESVVG